MRTAAIVTARQTETSAATGKGPIRSTSPYCFCRSAIASARNKGKFSAEGALSDVAASPGTGTAIGLTRQRCDHTQVGRHSGLGLPITHAGLPAPTGVRQRSKPRLLTMDFGCGQSLIVSRGTRRHPPWIAIYFGRLSRLPYNGLRRSAEPIAASQASRRNPR